MAKRSTIFFMVFMLLASSAFAKKNVVERSMGDVNSWQEDFGLEGKPNGTYNYIVTAVDKAGNEAVNGPFNITIDAESDLPVASITSPSEQMRVTGNINIVGTCQDDDGVSEVWLIIDGDSENPVKAVGTDFWSYYLDTTSFAEGPHTIEAYGIDNGNPEAFKNEDGTVDESKVVPKKGNGVKVTWQLDRRAPVTTITNYNNGDTVGNKISLTGYVYDGNGIDTLEYSVDGGVSYEKLNFSETHLKDEQGVKKTDAVWAFNAPIDTRKFEDGGAIIWFKAYDKTGTVGYNSFLFFIDNTLPELTIISPEVGEKVNGVLTVTGYAWDANGFKKEIGENGKEIERVYWNYGNMSGDIELIPGNPYWAVDIDTSVSGAAQEFVVTATDRADNTVMSKRILTLDQESDKPVLHLMTPAEGAKISGEDGSLFLRGWAQDDDAVASVTYKIDGGKEQTVKTTGTFDIDIAGTVDHGDHTVTMYATDRFGTKGNPVTNTFYSTGVAPVFEQPLLRMNAKDEGTPWIEGTPINNEGDTLYTVNIVSTIGIEKVSYSFSIKGVPGEEKFVSIKTPVENFKLDIPMTQAPWGVSTLKIFAEDIYGQQTTHYALVHIQNLNDIYVSDPGVFFEDTGIDESGGILLTDTSNMSGYFVGGKIAKVEFVPPTDVASVDFDGNSILLNKAAGGASGDVVVRVTTDQGATYDSKPIHFMAEAVPPEITINNDSASTGIPMEFQGIDSFTVDGNVTPGSAVSYRILTVKANIVDGILKSSEKLPIPSYDQETAITTRRSGNFSVTFKDEDFADGISIIEFMARNNSGIDVSQAVLVRKIGYARTDLMEGETEVPTPDTPKVYWVQGNEIYAVAIWQDNLAQCFSKWGKDSLQYGNNKLTFTASPLNSASTVKPVSSTFMVEVGTTPLVKFYTVDGIPYASGTSVFMEKNADAKKGHKIGLYIEASSQIREVKWSIKTRGENIVGGNGNQSGSVPARLCDNYYEADIPLVNLPVGMADVTATVVDKSGKTASVHGVITVLRTNQYECDDEKKVYWGPLGGAIVDEQGQYVLNDGARLYGYANFSGKVKANLARAVSGVSVFVEDHLIVLKATKDGVYKDVTVVVTDDAGGSYTADPVTLVVDTSKPILTWNGPAKMGWVQDKLSVSGKAVDGNGIASIKYSLSDYDGSEIKDEAQWKSLTLGAGGSFSDILDLSSQPDGYMPLSILVTDHAGKTNFYHSAFQKDTTPPEVKIIAPVAGKVVNGENLIVFSVKDQGSFKTITYKAPGARNAESIDYRKQLTVEDMMDEEKLMAVAACPRFLVGGQGAGKRVLDQNMEWTFADEAGNVTKIKSYDFTIDAESDLPIAEIHLPTEGQVITTDFIISGVLLDDDGECSVEYKIDKGAWKQFSREEGSVTMGFQYDIPVALSTLTDNEHSITVRAKDRNGVLGKETVSTFKVSLEDPKGSVDAPTLEQTVKGTVVVKGKASDKNGIEKVQVSVDNGASYNDAVGTENWSYEFDTNVIPDGTHAVFVKIIDKYGIVGNYSSLLNIDNTAPEIVLELPLDDSHTTKEVFFSGQTMDNIGLTELYINVRSLDRSYTVPANLSRIDLKADKIITTSIDLSALPNGFYNIQLTGEDAGGNVSRVSRNIQLDKNVPLTTVSLLYPLNGVHVQGKFNIYGSVESLEEDVTECRLFIDGQEVTILDPVALNDSGYFKFHLENILSRKKGTHINDEGIEEELPADTWELTEGQHKFYVSATTESGKKIKSNEQTFIYSPCGPWITLDNFDYGAFAVDRPKLSGDAGYVLSKEDIDALHDKSTHNDVRRRIEGKTVDRVYLSLDNGRTWEPVSSKNKGKWKYRVENEDIEAGYHFLLVKAQMKNGESAITRTLVQVDRKSPEIKMISPGVGGHYNQILEYSGLVSDDVALKDVKLTLREGNKNQYELPSFIQGLYLDGSFWGATLWDVGVGLTFFDNAVKIQGNFGQFTQGQRDAISNMMGVESTRMRFGGNVIGARIIAQVGYLPFRYFFGRDFDWLTATFAIGANFSYFSESGAIDSDGNPTSQVLTAAFAQIEFPRVTFKEMKYFKTWAFYTEPQVWFISSDVASDDAKRIVPTVSFGIHAKVF